MSIWTWLIIDALMPLTDDLLVLLAVPRHAAPGSAEVKPPDDRRQVDLVEELDGVLDRGDGPAFRVLQSDRLDDLAERLAVLGPPDDLAIRTDHLDVVRLEDPLVPERAGAVESGLTPERREDGVDRRAERRLLLDHPSHGLGGDRLDVGAVAERRIGHDRGGIGVDQHDAVALLAERLARLGPR